MSNKRGFAGMSREARQAAARRGGIAAHANGTAHKWTVEDARAAGRKGGLASVAKRVKQVQALQDEEVARVIEQAPFSQAAFGGSSEA